MSSSLFQFTVTDAHAIEGYGLLLSPYFPLDKYRFDKIELVRIQTPDGHAFETTANFEIPRKNPMPKIFETVCVIQGFKKSDMPAGSIVTMLNKTMEQILGSNEGSTN